jgi:NAD(P)-dependent dehydrogenase (short-subunit alcohol dehydrogenase family)
VGELIMAGRMAQPDEIADAMLFLCSPQAGYMTGQMVNVDGPRRRRGLHRAAPRGEPRVSGRTVD